MTSTQTAQMTHEEDYPSNRGRPSSSLHFKVGEMSGKLDQILASILPQLTELKADHSLLEGRVDGLEKWQARLLGGGAVVVFIITALEVLPYVIRL